MPLLNMIPMRLLPAFLLFVCVTTCAQPPVQTGADQLDRVLAAIGSQRIALLVNHTARVGNRHLVDTLLARGARVQRIFSPEHGFRGTADAGEFVKDDRDTRSGLPVISLYGNQKKPLPVHLADVDAVIFDIQDVGARFYTYISSLHYLMEACAEQNKKVIVLDRPNPNAFVDGPVLQPELKSFVGMHPIPIAHGLTVGELARMINGEGWLAGGVACQLEVIAVRNWTHEQPYPLTLRPSPNLPNDNAIGWYPSTCLLEGTAASVGRGTEHPFEWLGYPQGKHAFPFSFTPRSIAGMAKNPPHEGIPCYGIDLSARPSPRKIDLEPLLQLYRSYPDKEKFFIAFFDKLAGTPHLRQQILDGKSETEIRASWQQELAAYQIKRARYLLYP